MSEPFIGEIRMVACNFAPKGWAFCNGQLLQIMENQLLYAIIGNTFGGDGRTTFALPDLRGRVPLHSGQGTGLSNYVLGDSRGTEKASTTPAGNVRVPASKGAILATNAVTGIQPINIVQPYLALNFIIALDGVFPVRT